MKNRIQSLDSLRGLAALTVVFHHCMLTLPTFLKATFFLPIGGSVVAFLVSYTPLHMFWDGHAAVILFFVLSGFVLTLPYAANKAPSYTQFVVKRIFRIYVPYIVVIGISSILLTIRLHDKLHGTYGTSFWFNQMWSMPMTPKLFGEFAWMSGNYTQQVDTTTWSLIHEMRISLIFPLLVWGIRRMKWQFSIVTSLIFLSFGAYLSDKNFLSFQFGETVYYIAFFILGSTFAMYHKQLTRSIQNAKRWHKVLLFVVGIGLYNWTWIIPLPMGNPIVGLVPLGDLMIAFGSMVFMSLALGSVRAQRSLDRKPFLWLGKVSYSLYLIHPIVLTSTIYLLGNLLPLKAELIFVPFISLFVAGKLYKNVESPAIRWGRFLSNRTAGIKLVMRRTKISKPSA